MSLPLIVARPCPSIVSGLLTVTLSRKVHAGTSTVDPAAAASSNDWSDMLQVPRPGTGVGAAALTLNVAAFMLPCRNCAQPGANSASLKTYVPLAPDGTVQVIG